ncbi:MAG TPA: dihydroorotate dehydrogenase electron transfer subunit [Clostridia bacterium]|nr:dihydroorotate dehydrogenase electron transfer subunit [Clostridia bacterium]
MAAVVQGRLMEKESLGQKYFWLKVLAPEIAGQAQPGQFVQVRCGDTLDPFLRRPLSLHRFHRREGTVEFLVQRKGKGTAWLAHREPGQVLDLLGPLGRGFTLHRKQRALLVGGGIGVAPLLALAEALARSGSPPVTLLGANSSRDLLKVEEFRRYSAAVAVSTLDGSAGRAGLVTELLEEELRNGFQGFIYTCGPMGMMQKVAELARHFGAEGEASLEANMACGIGVCLGCTCEIRGEQGPTYAHVCTDGPVFPLEAVIDYV